jgi:hypothetical protein
MWAMYGGGYGGSGYSASPGDYMNAMMQNAGSDNPYSRERRNSYSIPGTNTQGPSAEERQQRAAEDELANSLKPAADEITSAKAINVLLADIRKTADKLGWEGLPSVSLDLDSEAWLHINLAGGEGNIAILKNDVPLTWPAALNSVDLQEQRKQFEDLSAQALLQARSQGTVDAATTAALGDLVTTFQRELRRRTPSLTFDQHLEAKSFLRSLEEAAVTLQRSDAGNYVTANLTPKATTMLDLVKWMSDRSLRFARALPGDTTAYTMLHQRLAAYDRMLKDVRGTP